MRMPSLIVVAIVERLGLWTINANHFPLLVIVKVKACKTESQPAKPASRPARHTNPVNQLALPVYPGSQSDISSASQPAIQQAIQPPSHFTIQSPSPSIHPSIQQAIQPASQPTGQSSIQPTRPPACQSTNQSPEVVNHSRHSLPLPASACHITSPACQLPPVSCSQCCLVFLCIPFVSTTLVFWDYSTHLIPCISCHLCFLFRIFSVLRKAKRRRGLRLCGMEKDIFVCYANGH